MRAIVWPFLIVPAWMRPMAMRPTNSDQSSVVTSICSGASGSTSGPGIASSTMSSSGSIDCVRTAGSVVAYPSRPLANRNLKSSRCSSAPISINRPNTSSSVACGWPSGRSILLITTIGRRPASSALESTKRVCGIGPSAASTSTIAPSAIRTTRSTSPPKSACPGVSRMLTFTPLYGRAMFLAKIVIPRSRSRSLLSSMNSWSSSLARNWPLCFKKQSTSDVFPWSTWAMITILRMSDRRMNKAATSSRGKQASKPRPVVAQISQQRAGQGNPPWRTAEPSRKPYLDVRQHRQNGLGELTATPSLKAGYWHLTTDHLRRFRPQMIGDRVKLQGVEQLAEAGHQIGSFSRGIILVELLGKLVELPAAVRPADIHHIVALFQHLIDTCPRHAQRLALIADRFGAAADSQSAPSQFCNRVAGINTQLLHQRLGQMLFDLLARRRK